MIDKKLEIVPKPPGFVYFERTELCMLVASVLVCGLPVYILAILGLLTELIGFILISSVVIFVMFVYEPYSRAKFIRQGGFYRLKAGYIEFVSGDGNMDGYSVAHMQFKICRRVDRVDLLFGKNLIDFIKYYGSKSQQGIGLYSIDVKQLDDALEALKLS